MKRKPSSDLEIQFKLLTIGANQYVGFMMQMGVTWMNHTFYRRRWASLLPGSRCLLINAHKHSIFASVINAQFFVNLDEFALQMRLSRSPSASKHVLLRLVWIQLCIRIRLLMRSLQNYHLRGGSESCSKCREAVEVWHNSEGSKLVCGHGQLLCIDATVFT